MLKMKQKIEHALQKLQPTHVLVHDDSEAHRGHSGYQEGGESHWHIDITVPTLADQNRITRQRTIHKALGPDILNAIHALSLSVKV